MKEKLVNPVRDQIRKDEVLLKSKKNESIIPALKGKVFSNGVKLISTFFYLGYCPVVPGTIGSLAGLAVYLLLKNNIIIYIIFTLLLLVLGFWSSGRAEKLFNKKDSSRIIIDEVCGILIALFLLPFTLPIIISAFFIFRAFDVIKPPPLDRLQNLEASAGIMLDDIMAGIYTNICFQLALKLLSPR